MSHIISKAEMSDGSVVIKVGGVNRSRSSNEIFLAFIFNGTGFMQFTNCEAMDSIPKGEGDQVEEVVFFKPNILSDKVSISDEEIENELEERGLKPADPISVVVVNEADLTFAGKNPHGTHWKDKDGKWCYLMFECLRGKLVVSVDYAGDDDEWSDRWWFAGIRK